MSKNKILFIKSLSLIDTAFPLRVRDNPKYDDNPLIDKSEIDKAYDQFRDKLNFLDNKSAATIPKLDINIEGRFLAHNIPEIPSIVIDEICTKNKLKKVLNKNDITHIALSTYGTGLDRTINLINIIQSEFNDIMLYIGGVGTVYPHLQELVNPKNICVGNGVNWLREKFNLKLLSKEDFEIPEIIGHFYEFPVKVNTSFLITQIGCPNNCDFCITTNLLHPTPFSNHKKIIKFIEDLSLKSSKDIFIFMCEPNAFYPESIWKKVFSYFIENPRSIDNNIFLTSLVSLNHINKFDLETIQKKSPLKFLMLSCGIESTLEGGYFKNKGNPDKIINRLNKLGIFTKHNFILGLPFHTREKIDLEIRNNLIFNTDLIVVNSLKPIPHTPIFEQLKLENRLYNRDLPPEFLYAFGFLPFNHRYLGGGFKILNYLFKAFYEVEKKTIDIFDKFANKLLDMFAITNSRKIRKAARLMMRLSKFNYNNFQFRMPNHLISIFQQNIIRTKERYKEVK